MRNGPASIWQRFGSVNPTRKVMVVEDQDLTRKMLRIALESEGHVVLEAPDGATARRLFVEQRPDLVILVAAIARHLQRLFRGRTRLGEPARPP